MRKKKEKKKTNVCNKHDEEKGVEKKRKDAAFWYLYATWMENE